VCCSVLQCVAVCCSVLLRVSVCCSVCKACGALLIEFRALLSEDSALLNRKQVSFELIENVPSCTEVCCSVLQCVAVCCSGVLQSV